MVTIVLASSLQRIDYQNLFINRYLPLLLDRLRLVYQEFFLWVKYLKIPTISHFSIVVEEVRPDIEIQEKRACYIQLTYIFQLIREFSPDEG